MSERQGLGLITTLSGSIVVNAITSGTSSIDVSDHYYTTIQPVVVSTGGGSITSAVFSSLDSRNWFQDLSFTASASSSSLYFLTGKRGALQARYALSGNCTCSFHILSGPA